MNQPVKSPEHLRIRANFDAMLQNPVPVLEAERELMTKKWFEYRFLSSKECNRQFLKDYQTIFRRKFAENIDAASAGNVSGANSQTMKDDARERSQLVAARQRADALGTPYNVYIEAAFDFALKRNNERKALPRPNQLLGNDRTSDYVVKHILTRWNEMLSNRLFKVEHPAYLISSYRNLPAQNDFRKFIIEHVKQTSMSLDRAIRKYTYDLCQIPLDVFKESFPAEMFDRAMQSVESDLLTFPVENPTASPLKEMHLWPNCFGLHYTYNPSSSECSSCPQASNCNKISQFTFGAASKHAGVDDPAADYDRRLARERQQRHRTKKREAKLLAAGGLGTYKQGNTSTAA
ncbi:hypothetical protein [Ochrobactrum quorumnocens]|uniref:hypothetical protein n=1 Tax=Ochrobactrum quorumnocens TaxID=271865 RepID=UPI003BA0E792